ncbi:MAG: sulfotransferase [Pseudomonadota bacterium]|nr:sulfotransferase [Pseudomonadota bacterium]
MLQPYTLYRSRCRSFSWGREQRKKVTFNYQIPEAIITGIPRSGTSYLCRLLHTVQNCVVINEPTQIFAPLKMLYPWQIALYYQDLRRDILNSQPVENKLYRGQVIEDTAVIDDRNFYLPRVSRPDFLLCTKNTLAYVARLTHLKYVMPQAPIIACVRHPLDAIASWKSSFAHLERAAVTEFAIGYLNDPLLEAWQQQHLQEITDTESLALKRALLWRYLAECVLRQRQNVILIRYEDLLEQSGLWIKIILQQIPHAPPACYTEKITASSARKHKRSLLDDEDIQAISDICGQYATELGY